MEISEDLIKFKIELTKQKIEKFRELINSGQLFNLINKHNPEIIKYYFSDENIVTFFIKNIIDENDENLDILCFEYSIEGDKLICKPSKNCNDALTLYDPDLDFDFISFDELNVDLTETELNFEMQFGNNIIPECVMNMIGGFFRQMLNKLNMII